MIDLLRALFDASRFVPRSQCGPWTPLMTWASQLGNLAIAAAYLTIAGFLAVLVRHQHCRLHRTFNRAVRWLAAFVACCSATHVCEVVVFYWPAYPLFVLVSVATAVVSVRAALLVPAVVRAALQAPTPQERAALIDQLQAERLHRDESDAIRAGTIARIEEHASRLEERCASDTQDSREHRVLEFEIAELHRILHDATDPEASGS